MKKIIAVILTSFLVLTNAFFVFADIDSTEIDPMLTNLLSMYYSPSDWGKDDGMRALLAISLYLDVSVNNPKIQDTFYVESLIKDAYLLRTGAGSKSIEYSLVILENNDLLMIVFKPSTGYAEYSVTSNVSKTTFNAIVQGYTHWEFDPESIDLTTDKMMEALSS